MHFLQYHTNSYYYIRYMNQIKVQVKTDNSKDNANQS